MNTLENIIVTDYLNGNAWCAVVFASWKMAQLGRIRWWRRGVGRHCLIGRCCNQSLTNWTQLLIHLSELPVVAKFLQEHPASKRGVRIQQQPLQMWVGVTTTSKTTKKERRQMLLEERDLLLSDLILPGKTFLALKSQLKMRNLWRPRSSRSPSRNCQRKWSC